MVETDCLPIRVEAIIYQDACSDTTEWDGRYMLGTNVEHSKSMHRFCQAHAALHLYASSAAVHVNCKQFEEHPRNESPINVYGYSKLRFDRWVRKQESLDAAQVEGLRYFNVYGPGEAHKGAKAGLAWHSYQQLREHDRVSQSATFNDVASAVIGWHGRGEIAYIPFPERLRGHYQRFTEADLPQLEALGCDVVPRSVDAGVREYMAEVAGDNQSPAR